MGCTGSKEARVPRPAKIDHVKFAQTSSTQPSSSPTSRDNHPVSRPVHNFNVSTQNVGSSHSSPHPGEESFILRAQSSITEFSRDNTVQRRDAVMSILPSSVEEDTYHESMTNEKRSVESIFNNLDARHYLIMYDLLSRDPLHDFFKVDQEHLKQGGFSGVGIYKYRTHPTFNPPEVPMVDSRTVKMDDTGTVIYAPSSPRRRGSMLDGFRKLKSRRRGSITEISTIQKVIIKRIPLTSEYLKQSFYQEVDNHCKLDHPNVVRNLGILTAERRRPIPMEKRWAES